MSELTQTLKILVTRYPGTMAELARKASIDRSTLYKIVSGQRTPREFQLEHLADALELSEEQKSALLLQYKQRGRGPDPRLRAELHHLLEVSFRVEDFTHREGIISNEAASQLRCSEQYIEGSRRSPCLPTRKWPCSLSGPAPRCSPCPPCSNTCRCGAPRPRTSISVRKVFCSLYAPGKCSTFRRICAMRRTFLPAGSCSCGCAALRSLTAAPCASWTLPSWRRLRR